MKLLLNGLIYPRLEAMKESLFVKERKEYINKVEKNEEGAYDGFVTSWST